MKICKVQIRKEFDGVKCTNIYPTDYDAQIMNVIAYDENPLNKGANIGFCIATVPDDFAFNPSKKMVEINQAAADAFIDARAEVEELPENIAKFKKRKQGIAEQIVIAATMAKVKSRGK